jgi:HD superfamily phosphohydrolase YqeK
MMNFIAVHQVDLMLVCSGLCGAIAIFVFFTNNLTFNRKIALIYTELASMLLLFSDSLSYVYRGDTSRAGIVIARVSNFFVYIMTLAMVHAFNLYIVDVFRNEGGIKKVPLRLRIVEILICLGELIVVISQFTGFLYYFDDMNIYHRGTWYLVSYVMPFLSLIIQLSVIIQYYKNLRRGIRISLLMFTLVPMITAVFQFFLFGLSLINISCVMMAVVIYIFALKDMNETVEHASKIEIEYLRQEHKNMQRMFEQTTTAFVNAIDAKDRYTHGHSSRVAEYARKIAEFSGKNEKECNEVYYAALLHDIGKIGIPDSIITKESRLTGEEYEFVKHHTQIGEQILSSIREFPYLSIGARYHHERYDGKGYPDKLKGEDIPEIARIVAVADAYDVMTSKRSYRDPISQQQVREEFVKGSGAQFDPKFAQIMIHLIDMDTEYQMKEKIEVKELDGKNELHCGVYRESVSNGIWINSNPTKIHLKCRRESRNNDNYLPALVLFDSLDAHIYTDEQKKNDWNYYEFGEIFFDGNTKCTGAVKMQADTKHFDTEGMKEDIAELNPIEYELEAVKYKDHAKIRISSRYETTDVIVALPDSSRFLYLSMTGTNCYINDVSISKSEDVVGPDYIPRISEEKTYIDVPEGDMPNIQIDGYRSNATVGIPIVDGLQIKFDVLFLPTARLVWHCPYISIFYSDNRRTYGDNYCEYALVRLDGEHWDSCEFAKNKMTVNMTEKFEDWDTWKENGKKGFECTVTFKREGNTITTVTENLGISIRNVTVLDIEAIDVFVSLTGDQVALTNIRVL